MTNSPCSQASPRLYQNVKCHREHIRIGHYIMHNIHWHCLGLTGFLRCSSFKYCAVSTFETVSLTLLRHVMRLLRPTEVATRHLLADVGGLEIHCWAHQLYGSFMRLQGMESNDDIIRARSLDYQRRRHHIFTIIMCTAPDLMTG